MQKKKRFALLMCAAMACVALVGGTMAYLTYSDSDVNVMTLGNVKIEQHEWQRADGVGHTGEAADGDLVPFEQGQLLMPAVPAAGAENPYTAEATDLFYWGDYVTADRAGNGLWNDGKLKNQMDKIVMVKNTGKSDAYYRTVIAFECPEDMEYSEGPDKDFMMNVNGNSRFDWEEVGYATIDGARYLLMVATYNEALAPNETSRPSLLQVVMTHNVENEDVALLGDTYEILVFSQAVQTEGFADAETALNAGFGEITTANHPWTNIAIVDSAEELIDALAAGGEVALAGDIKLEDSPIVIANGAEATLDLNGFKLQGIATNAGASSLIKVNENATLTIKDGTVSFGATTPDTNWGGDGQPPYPGYANNTISNLGTLIIDGATIVNVTEHGGASYAIDCYQGSELIVNSGKIDGQGKCAIRMFCNSNTLSTDVTINGGTITGKRAIWVQLPGSNINNVRPVNLTINGGELICTNTGADVCVYSYSYGDSFANTNITITGGTFTGDVCFGGGSAKSTQENVTITGGTFNGELGRYLDNDGWEDIAKP